MKKLLLAAAITAIVSPVFAENAIDYQCSFNTGADNVGKGSFSISTVQTGTVEVNEVVGLGLTFGSAPFAGGAVKVIYEHVIEGPNGTPGEASEFNQLAQSDYRKFMYLVDPSLPNQVISPTNIKDGWTIKSVKQEDGYTGATLNIEFSKALAQASVGTFSLSLESETNNLSGKIMCGDQALILQHQQDLDNGGSGDVEGGEIKLDDDTTVQKVLEEVSKTIQDFSTLQNELTYELSKTNVEDDDRAAIEEAIRNVNSVNDEGTILEMIRVAGDRWNTNHPAPKKGGGGGGSFGIFGLLSLLVSRKLWK